MKITLDLKQFESYYNSNSLKNIETPLNQLNGGCMFKCNLVKVTKKKKQTVQATVLVKDSKDITAIEKIKTVLNSY